MNVFNKYFANIGCEIARFMPDTKATSSQLLKPQPHINGFFYSQHQSAEIEQEISKLNVSKATGPFSIPTKILKLISKPLEIVFNNSFPYRYCS